MLGLANGSLAGLVAITAGCDVITVAWSPLVGVVAGVLYILAVDLRLWLRIDDVVDAVAVHGAGGLWGVVAVGLFHFRDGLITTQSNGAQLGSQLVGALVIVGISAAPATLLALALRRLGLLRVTEAQEARGHDYLLFGLRAYTLNSASQRHMRDVVAQLRAHGHSPEELIEALAALRHVIFRSLTPQAADHKLEGECLDFLSLLDVRSAVTDERCKHLAFLSHHKSDAGDAARILRDTARRLTPPHQSSSVERAQLGARSFSRRQARRLFVQPKPDYPSQQSSVRQWSRSTPPDDARATGSQRYCADRFTEQRCSAPRSRPAGSRPARSSVAQSSRKRSRSSASA